MQGSCIRLSNWKVQESGVIVGMSCCCVEAFFRTDLLLTNQVSLVEGTFSLRMNLPEIVCCFWSSLNLGNKKYILPVTSLMPCCHGSLMCHSPLSSVLFLWWIDLLITSLCIRFLLLYHWCICVSAHTIPCSR